MVLLDDVPSGEMERLEERRGREAGGDCVPLEYARRTTMGRRAKYLDSDSTMPFGPATVAVV